MAISPLFITSEILFEISEPLAVFIKSPIIKYTNISLKVKPPIVYCDKLPINSPDFIALLYFTSKIYDQIK